MSQNNMTQDADNRTMDGTLRERILKLFSEFYADDEDIHETEIQFVAFVLARFGLDKSDGSVSFVEDLTALPEVTPQKDVAVGEANSLLEENSEAALWFLENRELLAHTLQVAGEGRAEQRLADARDARRYRVLRAPEINGYRLDDDQQIGHFAISQKVSKHEAEYLSEALLDQACDERLRANPSVPVPICDAYARSNVSFAQSFKKRHDRQPTAHELFMGGVVEGRRREREEAAGTL